MKDLLNFMLLLVMSVGDSDGSGVVVPTSPMIKQHFSYYFNESKWFVILNKDNFQYDCAFSQASQQIDEDGQTKRRKLK